MIYLKCDGRNKSNDIYKDSFLFSLIRETKLYSRNNDNCNNDDGENGCREKRLWRPIWKFSSPEHFVISFSLLFNVASYRIPSDESYRSIARQGVIKK